MKRSTTFITLLLFLSLGAAMAGESALPPRAHIVRGLWHRDYRIEEALGHLGGAVLSESWHGSGASWNFSWSQNLKGRVLGLPGSLSGLLGNDFFARFSKIEIDFERRLIRFFD